MAAAILTAARLRELIRYDQSTGNFSDGEVAACEWTSKTNLYLNIKVQGRLYLAHRLAWLYVYGEWPKGQIDHINRVKHDNRIVNLRPASQILNQQNKTKAQSNSTSGFRGVQRAGVKFQAQIVADSIRYHLGTFDTAELAADAYKAAKSKLHRGAVLVQ